MFGSTSPLSQIRTYKDYLSIRAQMWQKLPKRGNIPNNGGRWYDCLWLVVPSCFIKFLFESHLSLILVSFESHLSLIRVSFESPLSLIPVSFESHSSLIRVSFKSHSSFIRVSFNCMYVIFISIYFR